MRGLLAFVFLAFALVIRSGSGVKLDSDGGYSITISVDPATPQPPGQSHDYLWELWDSIEIFSANLFQATDQTFFIKRIDLILPSEWEIGVANSTFQSFEDADIRLTPSATTVPYVENLRPCGQPGSFIKLPAGFLNTTNVHPYGHPSKSLMNLWAKFRYGVWEEHGQQGSDSKFPHFYKDTLTKKWEVTGCSNTRLEGTFTDLTGQPCDSLDGEKPIEGCRFRPSVHNLAKSSLMGFHWMESVTEYCNDDNHNKVAPTPQNLFCAHQSVGSVIKGSADWSKVTNRVPFPPAMEYNIVKKAPRPSLYILMDNGDFTQNNEAITIIPEFILTILPFFEQINLRSTMVSIATFPSTAAGTSIDSKMSWSTIYDHMEDIYDALQYDLVGGASDWAAAILSATNEIEPLNPTGQSAFLVLKTGNGAGRFDTVIPEEQVLSALTRNKISLFVAELENTDGAAEYPNHLKNLAEKTTNGIHVGLKTRAGVKSALAPLLTQLAAFLTANPPAAPSIPQRVLYQGKVGSGTRVLIPLRRGLETGLEFHLTLPRSVDSTLDVTWTGNEGQRVIRSEWNTNTTEADPTERLVYSVKPALGNTVTEFDVGYTCSACASVVGDLLITSTSAPAQSQDDIVVTLTTSAVGGSTVVDFGNAADAQPLAIYAKVESGGKAVTGPGLSVHAEISRVYSADPAKVVVLEDNGYGSPDLFANDGVYSGVFAPSVDGSYRIGVNVQFKPTGVAGSRSLTQVSGKIGSRLLPEDQSPLPPQEVITLDLPYSTNVQLDHQIVFRNATALKTNTPFKILDLSAQYDNSGSEIVFRFKSPKLWSGVGQASKFIVQGAASIDTLIHGSADAKTLHEVTNDKNPHESVEFSIEIPTQTQNVNYFRILAEIAGGDTGSSNIVQVEPWNPAATTTTTTTTTTKGPDVNNAFRISSSTNPILFAIILFITKILI
jgi:hypothetical protein